MFNFRRITEDWRVYTETLERDSSISLRSAEAEARERDEEGCVEGTPNKLERCTDGPSARAISQRLGSGRRAKHLEAQTMWVQQMSNQNNPKVHKVAGEEHEGVKLLRSFKMNTGRGRTRELRRSVVVKMKPEKLRDKL